MEVNGIDPEIVGNQPSGGVSHGSSAAQQVAQAATGGANAAKPELGDAGAHGPSANQYAAAATGHDVGGGVVDPHSGVTPQSVAAQSMASQYASAAAYGPSVAMQGGAGSNNDVAHARVGKRRVRLGWTEEETQNLMEGCKRHGVGNWKKILTDPNFSFNCRTAVDLKDRFRTSFPEEYSRLYPNARTHKVKRHSSTGAVPSLIKVSRKERRAFTADEDDRLLQGFMKHGPAWSKIQRDHTLGLSDRRSTDLRDRFRNAFPERYTAAGYKGRSSGGKSSSGVSKASGGADGSVGGADMQGIHGSIDDELAQQQSMMAGNRYMPGNMMHMPYSQHYNPQAAQYPQAQRAQAQQYNPQAQQYQQQYQQPMYYGMGMNAQMPMQMAGMNQLGQMNPQVRAQVPLMNTNQMSVWPNQQQ